MDIFQAFNASQSSLVENRKDYDYADIWMCISNVYQIHRFFVSQNILEYD